MSKKPLSYKDAGVDITAGNALVEQIKNIAKATHRPEVLAGLGGFGGLFALPLKNYQEPILVAGTDGVGTKLKLAIELQQHATIGIDLVAMCVNDLIVQGAAPLFFLDYYATSKLDIETARHVIQGIGAGCQQAGCALLGGETAEMPGIYQSKDYDLAGFCVGIVDKSNLITGANIKQGDAIIGLTSSGPHSNGYSLIRKVITTHNIKLQEKFANSSLGETLLTPTKIYVKPILKLLQQQTVHGIAHITGGGLLENIPRILPPDCTAVLDKNSWQWPPIFTWLQQQGNIHEQEMLLTFNCGVGMVLIIPQTTTAACIDILTAAGETAWQIGTIKTRHNNQAVMLS